jgi:hypothetical protein
LLSTNAIATIGVQAAMTFCAQTLRVKQRSILPVADVMQLELHLAAAQLAPVLRAQKRRPPNYRTKFSPSRHTAVRQEKSPAVN